MAGATAIGIGTAVGGVFSSLFGASSSKKAAKQAAEAARYQAELQRQTQMEYLAFAKEQYAKWEEIYGPIQADLADYYNNLSAENYNAKLDAANVAAKRMSATNYAQARKQQEQQLAARGITNSGVAVAADVALNSARLSNDAAINYQTTLGKLNSDEYVMGQKQGFLSLGLGQQASNINSIGNAYGTIANSAGQNANQQLALSQYYNQQQQGYLAGIGQSIGAGVNIYTSLQQANSANSALTANNKQLTYNNNVLNT